MANKQRHQTKQQPASSRATLVVLSAGGLLVAALVVWALTRTVEPAATTVADTAPSAPISTPVTTAPPLNPTTTNMPLTATQTPSPFSVTPAPTTGESPASVPRISVEDLREQQRTGAVTIIDVRDDSSFATAHIPGALHIPFARVEGEMASLPKGKPIVAYCS